MKRYCLIAVGFFLLDIVCLVSGTAFIVYRSWSQPAPHYAGRVHDCQKVNWEAFRDVAQLMMRGNYHPEVEIHRYPEDEGKVVLSLLSPESKLHLIFRPTDISAKDVRGKVPKPTVSNSLFAQR